MKRNITMVAVLALFTLAVVGQADAKVVDFNDGQTYGRYQVSIISMMFNGTVGTSKALDFASLDEPLVITNVDQTIAINIREWGIDTSRAGAVFSVSNGTVEYFVPLQRGWGTQIDEVSFGKIKVQIGITEIFRGRTKEFVKICVVVRKLPS